MRIAIVTATFPPYRGGMGNVAAQHARLLAELGHDVTVLTAAAGRAIDAPRYRVRRLTPLLRIGNGAVLPQLAAALRGAELVFLHYPAFGLLEGVLAWKIAAGRRRSRLAVVYHMDPVAGGLKGALFTLFAATSGRAVLRAADAVVVSSEDYALAGALGRMPDVVRRKLVELPLAVDIRAFAIGPCTAEDAGRFGLAERNALFVGGMDRAHAFKGAPVLLRAFAALEDANAALHLVGTGSLMDRYRRLAVDLSIAPRVRFHGALPEDSLARLYRCADVLVLPSTGRSEAFGLVVLEAMASGTPVIASRLPGVRTVVADGETGWLVAPGDVGALTGTLRDALAGGRRTAMGEAARRRAEAYGEDRLRQGLARLVSSFGV